MKLPELLLVEPVDDVLFEDELVDELVFFFASVDTSETTSSTVDDLDSTAAASVVFVVSVFEDSLCFFPESEHPTSSEETITVANNTPILFFMIGLLFYCYSC